MSRTAHHQYLRINRRRIVGLCIVLVFLYLVVPQFASLHTGITSLREVEIWWAVLAFAAAVCTYGLTTTIYCLLAKKLQFSTTLLVQFASTFINRILPAGAGAVVVNYEYLRHRKHTIAEATAVVALNNTLGSLGHLLLLVVAFLLDSSAFAGLRVSYMSSIWIAILLLIGTVIVATGLVWRRRLPIAVLRQLHAVVRSVLQYRENPTRLLLSLLCSVLMTSLYGLCLWACAQAFGVSISAIQALLVLSAGVLGATLTPTPGGLVGAEAALAAGLVAVGTSFSAALAIVLLYRLITYWLMLLLGLGAFMIVERKRYLG